jgi:hypothetical protein
VASVMAGLDTSSLDDRHKALFRLIDKVNHDSASMTAADVDAARAAGWTDEALYFAITVCALFNFYNRWIDATGVHGLSDDAHREGGRRLAVGGYTLGAPGTEPVGVQKSRVMRMVTALMRVFTAPPASETAASKPFPYPIFWP